MAGLGVGGIGGMPGSNVNIDPEAMLNTCIHNYFISKDKPQIAKAIRDSGLSMEHGKLKMENKPHINGADAGDVDTKDDKSRLGGLESSDNFLLDYWFIFWDMWKASKEKADPNTAASQYLQMTQNQRQMRPNNLVQPGAVNNFGQMRANPNAFTLQRQAQLNTLNGQNQRRGPMAQQPMQRDGSAGEMNGDQRPGSPMSNGESAPSPKRQRLEGNFNGQPMGFGGRNSLGSQLPNGAGGNMEAMMMQQGMNPRDPQGRNKYQMALAQNQMAAQQAILNTTNQTGMALPAGSFNPNASPMMAADGAPLDMSMMANVQMRNSNGNGNQGGALADYQMQLMLLEQQNKKRLMMARQETEHPAGFSGTPPHGRNGSPMPDSAIRNSPAPPFNPGQADMNGQFPPQMRVGDAVMGGNAMLRNSGTHQLNGQNMEIFRRQNGQMPNGQWQGAPMQGQMMPRGQAGPQQQGENGQQQRGNMPPPQAPAAGNKQQPSPPTQAAAPPTPSQKKDGKGKKDGKAEKKKTSKSKAANASATPQLENDRPPTPVPQTPVTPVNPDAQVIKGQNNHQTQTQAQPQQQQQGAPNQQAQGNQQQQQQQQQQLNNGQMPPNHETASNEQPFGAVDNYASDFDFGTFMHNTGDGGEGHDGVEGILGGFDFGNFLNDDTGTGWNDNEFFGDAGLGAET